MSTFVEELIQSMKEALAHANGNGPAIIHVQLTPREVRKKVRVVPMPFR